MSKTQSPPQDEVPPSRTSVSQFQPQSPSRSERPSSSPAPARPLAGEEAWQCVAQQIRTFKAQQEESQRALALLAREQAAFLADLDGFVNGQVQVKLPWHVSVYQRQTSPEGEQSTLRQPQSMAVTPRQVQSMAEPPQLLAANGRQLAPAPTSPHFAPSTASEGSADEEEDDVGARKSTREFGRVTCVDTTYNMVPIELMNNMHTTPLPGSGEPTEIPPLKDGVCAWSKAVAGRLLASRYFEPLMGFIIALNAANIGWMIDTELKGGSVDMHETLEFIFLQIFIAELALRLFVRGWGSLKVAMNAFDFLIVAFNVLTIIIYPMLKAVGGEEAVQYLQQVMVLRMMRLLRLARAVRLVASFRSLWKLVQGLMHSFGTMVSAMVLMFIIIFIFACFGAEFITKQNMNDPEVGELVAQKFSSLPQILLTLFQFISMDSIAAFYVPLIERSPGLVIYFLLLLVIVAIALMNLVTALLVEDAISSSQMDEEMQTYYTRERLKHLKPALRDLFKSLDRSGFGHLHAKDVMNAIRAGIRIPIELQEFINPARMLDLFEALDSDHSGDLTEDEFVDGLASVALADVPIETLQILHLLRSLRKEIQSSSRTRRFDEKLSVWMHSQRPSEKRSMHQVSFDLNGATNMAMQQMSSRSSTASRSRSLRSSNRSQSDSSQAEEPAAPVAPAASPRGTSKRGTVAVAGEAPLVNNSTASEDDDDGKGGFGEEALTI